VLGGQNDNFQEVHWDEDLIATGTIQEIQIEFPLVSSDVTGYYPAFNWSDTNPTDLANYMQTPVTGAPTTVNYFAQPNKQVVICTWAAPINLTGASLDFGIKVNPKDQTPNVQRYTFKAQITYAGALR